MNETTVTIAIAVIGFVALAAYYVGVTTTTNMLAKETRRALSAMPPDQAAAFLQALIGVDKKGA